MIISKRMIGYGNITQPTCKPAKVPVDLTQETMDLHKQKIVDQMKNEGFDALLIYADREHGANFGYLTGYEPRFEEAALILHKDGNGFLLLGNESLRMERYTRIPAKAIHVPQFSLPNQPMNNEKSMKEIFKLAEIQSTMKVGIVGWKMFTSLLEDNKQSYDVPYFIVDAMKNLLGLEGKMENACRLFIHPGQGARATVTANEIAHYEFGSSLTSNCILNVMEQLEIGQTEMELAENLSAYGQPLTVQTICATGERFTNAVVAPRNKKVKIGDKFSVTMGLRGGLTNRSAYVVKDEGDFPEGCENYLKDVVVPYFSALASWYSTIQIGMTGGELYDIINNVIPKETHGWEFNPGHLIGSEEWMSTPVYPKSENKFQSGMMLQMDVIINIPGYGGSNAEDGIVLADESLQKEIRETYPDVWKRMMERRGYMENVIGIPLHKDVLPMSNLCGYLRPYLLEKTKAMYVNIKD